MELSAKVRTCLWFESQGHDAAEFYVSLLPDSEIENIVQPDPEGAPLVVEFRLGGAPYMVLNGKAEQSFDEAASISILAEDQQELDRLWSALLAHGGSEGQCGWLKDRFGVSWQLVPRVLPGLLAAKDRAAAGRVMEAMMGMRKLDIHMLKAAAQGEG